MALDTGAPAAQPLPQIQPTFIQKHKPILIGAGVLGFGGYGFYKIGKLPDSIPHERLYVGGALVLGVFGFLESMRSAWVTHKKPLMPDELSGSLIGGGIAYMIIRDVFKQSPKKSLIITSVLAAATICYVHKDAILNAIKPKPVQQPQIAQPIAVAI